MADEGNLRVEPLSHLVAPWLQPPPAALPANSRRPNPMPGVGERVGGWLHTLALLVLRHPINFSNVVFAEFTSSTDTATLTAGASLDPAPPGAARPRLRLEEDI